MLFRSEGDTAAIFALAVSADGETIGTIEIEGSTILTPEGGKVIDYRNKEELSDGVMYEAGQTIGTGDATIDSPYDAAVAKSTVIVPPEETKPEEKHGKTKPVGCVYQRFKVIWRAVARGRRKIAAYLIAKRTVERMLQNAHELYSRVSACLDARQYMAAEIGIAAHAVALMRQR